MNTEADVNVTPELLTKMCLAKPNKSNLNSVVVGLQTFGPEVGLLRPQRLAHYLCQIMHESGSFKYDKEIWGPTAAQKRYEGRKDLGNTKKGDGKKFMGHTAIQITGRGNTTRFYKWCLKLSSSLGLTVPDFTEQPELMNTDPWEGAGPIWYWDVGSPSGQSINRWADQNNIEMVTKSINGGLNGLGDRIHYYTRCALVLLGYEIGTTAKAEEAAIRKFQKDDGFKPEDIDGIAGQQTRMALHNALGGKNPFKEVIKVEKPKAVEVPVAVTSKDAEKPFWQSKEFITQATGGLTVPAVAGWVTDVPTDKILLFMAAAVVVGVGAFLYFRYLRHQDVQKQVEVIEAKAETKKDEIKDQRAEAEVAFKEAAE